MAAGLEEQEEYGLLDAIFSDHSSVVYEVFIQNMTSAAKWGFDAAQIRKVVFEDAAKITYKSKI